jgi:hypothetical protein
MIVMGEDMRSLVQRRPRLSLSAGAAAIALGAALPAAAQGDAEAAAAEEARAADAGDAETDSTIYVFGRGEREADCPPFAIGGRGRRGRLPAIF